MGKLLCMSEKHFNATLQLGQLALQSGRFEEAESLYLPLLQNQPSAFLWCSIAMARFGRIFTGETTVDEIFDCFHYALELDTEKTYDTEVFMLESSLIAIKKLYEHCYNIFQNERKQRSYKTQAFMAGLLSISIGDGNHENMYRSILNAGITAFTAKAYVESANAIENLREQKLKYATMLQQIKGYIRREIKLALEERKIFDSGLVLLQQSLAKSLYP